ncbi:MAG: carboxypeptidase-like regulatory domain-containing protein, partial [Cyclobacteriaceae bacterium]|nr:carboxypeptidase-like regulatory domain-containing protein [Cyclobacteriaceae bacterium]
MYTSRFFASVVVFITLFVALPSSSQVKAVTVSGMIKDKSANLPIAYANVIVKTEKDSAFVSGTISNEEGRFALTNVKPGNYYLEFSFVGYATKRQSLYVGSLTDYLDLATIELTEDAKALNEV